METKTFPAQFDHVRAACQFVRDAAERAGFDQKSCFHIELACDEACTNIIEHAYEDDESGEITVAWELNDRAFEVTLGDQGRIFDPTTVEPPQTLDPEADVDEIAIGGLGMHFMRKLMDEVRYQFGDQGNRVKLIKWLPLPPGVQIDLREIDDDVFLLRIFGRLDNRLAEDVEQHLRPLAEEPQQHVIVDLSNVDYINSAGLRVLVSAWRKAHQRESDIVLYGLNQRLHEIFAMVGFDKIFHIFKDVNDARAYLEAL